MIRAFAVILSLYVAVFLNTIFQNNVTVNIVAPAEVVAGSEFQVSVSVSKGDLETFSRLQQDLPAGLRATVVESQNADFSFEDKRARFIWLKMPAENQFIVTYNIKVDERLKGVFSIGGKFSFIDDNERRAVNTQSNLITILPSPNIDPSLIVDIEDYEKLIIPYIEPSGAEPLIACVRQEPMLDKTEKVYIVTLLVSKERKEKFAKIEESVPAGYRAESLNPHDAIFTFKDHTAKFLWMNLPASSLFTVSYKLIPTSATAAKPEIKGEFSYLEENKTSSIPISQTSQDITSIKTTQELNSLLASLPTEQFTQTSTSDAVTVDASGRKIIQPPDKKVTNLQYVLEPEEGIYYRVQLAAGHKPVDVKRYFRKYNLDKEVRKEIHEGWHKYSIGSFKVYREARDYRVHIWNTTEIDDAFVSAYNNGNRITVQEALMIANQKWYK